MKAICRRHPLLVFTLLAPLGAWAADLPARIAADPAVPNSECMDCHEGEFNRHE